MHLEQINDHRGNSFKPTVTQSKLYKAGWRLTERKKNGCVWIVRWVDPDTSMIWNQKSALQILRDRVKAQKAIIRIFLEYWLEYWRD